MANFGSTLGDAPAPPTIINNLCAQVESLTSDLRQANHELRRIFGQITGPRPEKPSQVEVARNSDGSLCGDLDHLRTVIQELMYTISAFREDGSR